MTDSRCRWAGAAVLGAAALAAALRWAFRSPFPVNWDAVDFALALDRFDLLGFRPHAPGYPVYVGLGGLVRRLVPDPILALSSLSAIAGGLAALPLAALAWRAAGPAAGALAALAWAVQPLAVVTGALPLSDSPGLLAAALVAAAALLPGPAGPYLAGLAWGVAAGVRLSNWPVALAAAGWLVRRDGRGSAARFAAGAAAGVLPWLAWLVSQEGAARLAGLLWSFAAGHFGRWGGTPWSEEALGLRGRLHWLGVVGAGQGLIGGWAAAAGLGLLAWAGRAEAVPAGTRAAAGTAQSGASGLLAAWAALTGLWVILGQNPQNARHLLPLAALLCVAAGVAAVRGLAAGSARRVAAGLGLALALAGWAAPAARLGAEARDRPPPVVALADDLVRHADPARAAVLTWEEERVVEYRHPRWTAIRVRSAPYMRTAVRALPAGTRVLATSKVFEGLPPAERAAWRWVALGRYRGSPLLYGAYADLALYALESRR